MNEPRYPYVHIDVPEDETEEVSYLLWELGALGVEERDASTLNRSAAGITLVASFADDAGAELALAGLAPRVGRIEHVVGDAWRDAYKQYFKVTRLGERLVIRPSWEPYEPRASDVVVTVDPGQAFGTGTHESTRLLMRALDARVRGGEHVLDVGCGTGILAICALRLGAARARCVDTDPVAIEVTRENAISNGVEALLDADSSTLDDIQERYALVLANIQADVLITLAPALSARVASRGLLMLSGILVGQEAEVCAAYPAFALLEAPREGEWIALMMMKQP